jgi:hypothetical protein
LMSPAFSIYPPYYRLFVRNLLETSYFVHFSGGFPFINII